MMTAHRVLLIDLVSGGHINEVKKLIESGCDVDEKSYVGQSADMATVQRNDPKILTVLINAGAKVDIQDGVGRSPLTYAKALGYKEVVSLIEESLAHREQLRLTCPFERDSK